MQRTCITRPLPVLSPKFLLNPKRLLVIYNNSRAGVVEWQTRRTQNPVGATLWGFKSPLRHHEKSIA
jgi:hypothetical protein